MLPLTSDLKKKIDINIKNQIDISDLIKDVNIKGADLSRAIINNIQITDRDISGCNFSYSVIGNDKSPCWFIKCKLDTCSFYGTNFVGKAWMRSCHAHNCNFKTSNLGKVDYQHSDFSGSNFCDSIIKIGVREWVGATLPPELFKEVCKIWRINLNQ